MSENTAEHSIIRLQGHPGATALACKLVRQASRGALLKLHESAWYPYEFQKQPDPLDVDMIIRTLTELSRDRWAAQNLDWTFSGR